MQFLLAGVSLGNQRLSSTPMQSSKGEFVSMWQRYVAPITSAHPWGRVQQEQLQGLHLKEQLVKA